MTNDKLKTQKKVYIKYCRPFEDADDEPPISDMWSDGERPKKKHAFKDTMYVYDEIDNRTLINERIWDGIE